MLESLFFAILYVQCIHFKPKMSNINFSPQSQKNIWGHDLWPHLHIMHMINILTVAWYICSWGYRWGCSRFWTVGFWNIMIKLFVEHRIKLPSYSPSRINHENMKISNITQIMEIFTIICFSIFFVLSSLSHLFVPKVSKTEKKVTLI